MSSSPSPSSSASPPTSTASPPSPSSPPASGVPPPPQIPSPAPPLPSPPPPEATSPPSGTTPSPPVPSRSPPPDATSPPSGTAPSPPVPSRSPPPAASPPPPFTVAPPPPPPSVPTTPNAPPPFPPSPPPPASQPPQSRPPPTGSPPPRSSPSRLPHSPASSSPPWLPLPSPPRNSSVPPNPPSLSPPSTVTPGGPRNSSSPEHGSGLKTGSFVAIGVVAALIAFRLVVLAVCVIKKRRKAVAEYNAGLVIPSPPASSMSAILRSQTGPLVQRQNPETTSRINSLPETPRAGTTPSFSYEELYRITNGFSPDNILGEGGFGSVYKGCLHNGREVAVKRLKIESKQGDREFKAEVEIISRVHHRHLVSLVGYCVSDNQRLLVYDFVPNGTLESHLHGNKRPAMDWATRVTVAAGAARGIAYLHEDCNPKIIHRDIKSSNILLDNNFEAQVSDFGLARLALELDGQTHVTTRVMGTFGYLAPEYASSGKLTEKSDVFSFGVVLLELITGQKPVDNTKPFGDESLVVWARPLLSHALATGELGELPDDRLQKNFNIREMLRMIEVAAACVRHSASMRPQMGKVVRVLDSFADIDLTSGVTPGQSEAFNVVNSANIRIFQQLALGNPGSTSDYALSDWSHQKDA